MSVITSGNSTFTASPTASALRFIPGPDVVVIAIAPPNDAPIAAHTPAISSSAWNVYTGKLLQTASSCSTSLAGVIGYEPRNNGRPDLTAAATKPSAVALLPVILRYSPAL